MYSTLDGAKNLAKQLKRTLNASGLIFTKNANPPSPAREVSRTGII